MRRVTLLLGLLACGAVHAPDREVLDLVSQLSWQSVGYDHMAMILWPKPSGGVADRLVRIGKSATPALLPALLEQDRGVAAHVILSKIYFPSRLESGEAPIYKGPDIVGFRYTTFGLTWGVDFDLMPREEAIARGIDPDSILGIGQSNRGEKWLVDQNQLEANFKRWCEFVPKKYREPCK